MLSPSTVNARSSQILLGELILPLFPRRHLLPAMNTSADSDNDNGEDETWPLQPRSAGVNGLLTTLVILVALTALVGNTLVILAVFLYHRLKDEVANLFIVNLSITDLSSAIVVMLSSAAAVGADRWAIYSHDSPSLTVRCLCLG